MDVAKVIALMVNHPGDLFDYEDGKPDGRPVDQPIPFMAMLGEFFPEAQFVITGVLGPNSNAHGPNEFLHIPYARKLTACVTQVLADHFTREEN